MRFITSAASAICGTHFGETNAVASIARNPASVSASIKATFSSVGTIAFSFCRPSRGPTSTRRTMEGSLTLRVIRLAIRESITSGAVADTRHRLSALEASDLGDDLCDRVLDHRDRGRVRRQRDPRMMPEGMAGRQRLVAEHVEHGAGEMAFVENRDQIL